MKKIGTEQVIDLLNAFSGKFATNPQTISSLFSRAEMMSEIKENNEEAHSLLDKFVNTWESYEFIKKDRDFMMKGRDLWTLQSEMFKNELIVAVETLIEFGSRNDLNINVLLHQDSE